MLHRLYPKASIPPWQVTVIPGRTKVPVIEAGSGKLLSEEERDEQGVLHIPNIAVIYILLIYLLSCLYLCFLYPTSVSLFGLNYCSPGKEPGSRAFV